jgi:hypothetical protein
MVKFIGQAGEFQKERSVNLRMNAILIFILLMLVVFFALGFISAKMSLWWSLLAAVTAVPVYKISGKLFDKQIRMARLDESGAAGELEILPYLKELPDSFTVVCDLNFADSFGNIDHLVIGPSGVFAIDVKNWRGTVSADGQGELLFNGQPTSKPQVRAFTRRVMDLKERLKALTKLAPFIQGIFVFPRTRVEAKWGATGAVHCIRIEQVVDYITKYRGPNPPSTVDISSLVLATEALKKLAGSAPLQAEPSER